MRLGIVDVGSLSLRFDIYEVHPDGSWELVEKLRSIPRIGEALFSTGAFSAEGKAQLTADLKRVADLAKAADVRRLQAVGTSALRDAPGVTDFLGELRTATGALISHVARGSRRAGIHRESIQLDKWDIRSGTFLVTLEAQGSIETRSFTLAR